MTDLTPHLAMIALGFIWGTAVQLFLRARESSRLVQRLSDLEELREKLEYRYQRVSQGEYKNRNKN